MRRTALKVLLALLVSVLAVHLANAPVYAAIDPPETNYCSQSHYDPDRCLKLNEYAGKWLGEKGVDLLLVVVSVPIALEWFVGATIVQIWTYMASTAWIEGIRNFVINSMVQIAPEFLQKVIFDQQNGLMFIMLFITGLLLMLPFAAAPKITGNRGAETLVWGILVSFFFVRTMMGYDLVREIDALRVQIMKIALVQEGEGTEVPVFARPMAYVFGANTTDVSGYFSVRSYLLPPRLSDPVIRSPKTEEATVLVSRTLGLQTFNAEVETSESKSNRLSSVGSLLLLGVVGLSAVLLMLFVLVTYLVVNLSAVAAIVLFFVSLPVGFFSAGRTLIGKIVNIYVMSVIFGILLGGLLRVVGGIAAAIGNTGLNETLPTATAMVPMLLTNIVSILLFQTVGGAMVKAISGLHTAFIDDATRLVTGAIVVSGGGGIGGSLGSGLVGSMIVKGGDVATVVGLTSKAYAVGASSIGNAVRKFGIDERVNNMVGKVRGGLGVKGGPPDGPQDDAQDGPAQDFSGRGNVFISEDDHT